jgi:hypothetical protein
MVLPFEKKWRSIVVLARLIVDYKVLVQGILVYVFFVLVFFVIVVQQGLVAPSIIFLLPLVLANIFSWQLLDDVKELGNPSEQLSFPLKSYLMYILTFVLIFKC